MAELNLRARADRVACGEVDAACVPISGDAVAGVGDRVITRHNDRRLSTGRGWVKNGDTWTVRSTGRDGSLTVHRENGRGTMVLPAHYVREHVDLGYATTAFRAQGRTLDTTHSLISHTTTREARYVAATRGRISNTLYIDTCSDPDEDTSHGDPEHVDARQVLQHVLDSSGAQASAHAVIDREAQKSPMPAASAFATATQQRSPSSLGFDDGFQFSTAARDVQTAANPVGLSPCFPDARRGGSASPDN